MTTGHLEPPSSGTINLQLLAACTEIAQSLFECLVTNLFCTGAGRMLPG